MPEIEMDWVQTARTNAVEIDKGRMQCRPEDAALLRGLADEIERLRAVILDIARIVENPDDRALQQVRDVTDKHSSLKDAGDG